MSGYEMHRNRLIPTIRALACLAIAILLTMPAPSAHAATRDAIWDGLLKTYVSRPTDGINRFDYAHVSSDDREKLETYLDNMQRLDPNRMDDADQRAYWINLYNAATVKHVLDHYPVDSIRDIRPGFFSTGPWNEKFLRVGDEDLSLNNIEHNILRKRWKDNRIHYALNCASLGCPNLQAEPFSAEKLDEQLDQAARAFVNHPRGADVHNGKLTVSSIYKWYAEDFGNTDASVIRHILSFSTEAKADQLRNINSIDAYEYDWDLNKPEATP